MLIGGEGGLAEEDRENETVAVYNTSGFVRDLPNLNHQGRVAPGCGLKINFDRNKTVCLYIYEIYIYKTLLYSENCSGRWTI